MSRDTTLLHPRLQTIIPNFVAKCKAQGLIIGIGECFRTVAEQDTLYAQGRTASGSIVTNAKGSTYSSMHQWGVAFDFYRNDGKGAYYDNDGFFAKVGKIGESSGLEWGGRWTSPVDKPHFQLADWGSTTIKLKALYGTFEKFKVTWIKEVDTEMVDKVNININGKIYEVDRVLKDGTNYVKLADFKQAGFDVGYNSVTKEPSFGVSVAEDIFKVNGVYTTVHKIVKNSENYVKVRDLESVIEIDYDITSKMVIINSK